MVAPPPLRRPTQGLSWRGCLTGGATSPSPASYSSFECLPLPPPCPNCVFPPKLITRHACACDHRGRMGLLFNSLCNSSVRKVLSFKWDWALCCVMNDATQFNFVVFPADSWEVQLHAMGIFLAIFFNFFFNFSALHVLRCFVCPQCRPFAFLRYVSHAPINHLFKSAVPK